MNKLENKTRDNKLVQGYIATKTVNATHDGNAALLQRMTTLCHPLHAWERLVQG